MSNAIRATLALYFVLVVAACTPRLDAESGAEVQVLSTEPVFTGKYN